MARILITGGAGFIGANAAARFLRRGWSVSILDTFSRPGSRENADWLRAQGEVAVHREDVRDRDALRRALRAHPDLAAILHLAGQVAVTTSITNPVEDCEINLLGTLNLLDAVREAGMNPAFLYASTNKVYGNLSGVEIRETGGRYVFRDLAGGISEQQPVDFHSPYGCSKGGADMYVLDHARIYGLRTVSLRQSCIYGPRQFGMEDQGWVAWFAICASLGRPITIFGDGKQVRDVLFIEDLLDCYERCIESIDRVAGLTFNIGGGPEHTLSLLELIGMLRDRLGLTVRYDFAPARRGDQKVYVSDIGRARQLLGWKPTVPAEDGVRTLVRWVADHRSAFESGPMERSG